MKTNRGVTLTELVAGIVLGLMIIAVMLITGLGTCVFVKYCWNYLFG